MGFTIVFVCLLSVVRLRVRDTFLAVELLSFPEWHVHVTKKVVNLEYCKFSDGSVYAFWLRIKQCRPAEHESVYSTWFNLKSHIHWFCNYTLRFLLGIYRVHNLLNDKKKGIRDGMSSESVQLKEHDVERPQQTGPKLLQFGFSGAIACRPI